MKKITLVFIVAVHILTSCGDDDMSLDPKQGITPELIKGTWLATREERLSDNWSQSDENGITTQWKILDPLKRGGEINIQAIKFSNDGTFVWNVTSPELWEHWKVIRNDLPREMWSTYLIAKGKDLVTLYTPFEYVGIIGVDTTEFRISVDANRHMILENSEVQLEFVNTMQY